LEARLQQKFRLVPSPIKELLVYSRTKGWGALYAGIKPCIAATAVSQGVYFYLYSAIRQAVVAHQRAKRAGSSGGGQAARSSGDSRTEDIGVAGSLVVAACAGAVNVLATNPMWIVATQMQALQKSRDAEQRKKSAVQISMDLYREEGPTAFWKGLAPALVMVVNPTLQYMLYEWLTARLLGWRREQRFAAASAAAARSSHINPAHAAEAARQAAAAAAAAAAPLRLTARDAFSLSALAKLGATLATYPLLVIKSRMQAANSTTAAEARYVGVWDAVARILGAEGLAGLFKGLRAKLVQTVLGAAILMAIKEQVVNTTRSALRAGGKPTAAVLMVTR